MIDYAYPAMMAERAMKEAHAHMLKHDHDAAIEAVVKAIAEAKLVINSIRHMKEQQNALRQQAKTV